jgi:hypothetical protein
VHVAVDSIIYKSYNNNRIVEIRISSLPYVKIVVCQKIWRGRRDANMTGGGGEVAAAAAPGLKPV